MGIAIALKCCPFVSSTKTHLEIIQSLCLLLGFIVSLCIKNYELKNVFMYKILSTVVFLHLSTD